MVRTRLNIGCRYSTPVHERPLHPTRSQFKPEASQTKAPVTPATEPERRAGGGLTTGKAAERLPFPLTRFRRAYCLCAPKEPVRPLPLLLESFHWDVPNVPPTDVGWSVGEAPLP